MGMAEMLQSTAADSLNSKQVGYLATIQQSSNRLLELINNLLEFTHLQSSTAALNLLPCSIAGVCQTALQQIIPVSNSKQQQTHYTSMPSEIILQTDEKRLVKILLLLLDNASKFTPKVRYEYEAPKTQPLGTGGDMHFAFSFGVQAAEVEVNKLTGEVKVLKVISANDVGMAVNPLGLQGQVEGGVMMGLGNCLTEEFIVENGNVVTDQLARYRVPGIMLTPEITAIIVEHPISSGPFGAKGVGEISSIPTTPAITNAIYNAVGVRFDKLPVDQEVIARELWEREEK